MWIKCLIERSQDAVVEMADGAKYLFKNYVVDAGRHALAFVESEAHRARLLSLKPPAYEVWDGSEPVADAKTVAASPAAALEDAAGRSKKSKGGGAKTQSETSNTDQTSPPEAPRAPGSGDGVNVDTLAGQALRDYAAQQGMKNIPDSMTDDRLRANLVEWMTEKVNG